MPQQTCMLESQRKWMGRLAMQTSLCGMKEGNAQPCQRRTQRDSVNEGDRERGDHSCTCAKEESRQRNRVSDDRVICTRLSQTTCHYGHYQHTKIALV